MGKVILRGEVMRSGQDETNDHGVLLITHDEQTRRDFERGVEQSGDLFGVVVSNVYEALAVVALPGHGIELLICDVALPEAELSAIRRELKSHYCPVPVAYVGVADNAEAEYARLAASSRVRAAGWCSRPLRAGVLAALRLRAAGAPHLRLVSNTDAAATTYAFA